MNLEKRKPTHINHQNRNNSSIDLSICSPIIDGYFEWDTADDVYRSDHFPIVISTLNNTFTTHQRPRWKLIKADWENYENELNINEKLICNDVNKTVYNITQQILTAANNNIPKSSSKINGHRSVPWWNEEVNKAVKLRKKILRFFNRFPTKENKINYLKARSNSRNIIESSKQKSFQEFTTSLNDKTPTKVVWDKIRAAKIPQT